MASLHEIKNYREVAAGCPKSDFSTHCNENKKTYGPLFAIGCRRTTRSAAQSHLLLYRSGRSFSG